MPTMNDETLHERYQRETAGDFARLESAVAEMGAEIKRLHKANDLLTHQVITCGVAARHPDANLTRTGAYATKWDSQQAGDVRQLRDDRDRLRAELAVAHEWLTHLAKWIDSYWQDGMRPDEWTMKEWAQKSRAVIKGDS